MRVRARVGVGVGVRVGVGLRVALLTLRDDVGACGHMVLHHGAMQHGELLLVKAREDDVGLDRAHDPRDRRRTLLRARRQRLAQPATAEVLRARRLRAHAVPPAARLGAAALHGARLLRVKGAW